MISWFRYVPYSRLLLSIAEGWEPCADLGFTHGQWSVGCMFKESWLPVVGYEGLYEVSSLGQVRSLDRHVKRPFPRTIPGRVMSPGPVGAGYLALLLTGRDGKKRGRYVAHLVAEAFIGPRPDGMQVCHNDGDRLNNAVFNLRYDTKAANELDKFKHGRVLRGEKCPAAKLNSENVREIRSLKGVESSKSLAARFGVTPCNIQMIQRRATWRGEGDPA